MKVIFLDNDGVMCLSKNWGSRTKKCAKFRSKNPHITSFEDYPISVKLDNFDIKAIKVLNEILKETDAEIVISSDWKYVGTLEELGDYYISQGFSKRPIGMTDGFVEPLNDFKWNEKTYFEQERFLEINQYLKDHKEITNWVVVDDLNLGYHGSWGFRNFVRTVDDEGIKKLGIKEKLIKILNYDKKWKSILKKLV